MAFDTTTVTAIIGAGTTALAGLLGWFSKQGVDAWLKLRADKREDAKLEDAREDALNEKEENTLRYIIGEQAGELRSVRAEVKEMQNTHRLELRALHEAHNNCEKRQAQLETELRVRMEFVNKRVTDVETKTHLEPLLKEAVKETKDTVHKETRQAVHDLREDITAVSLKSQLEQAKQLPQS